MSDPARQQLQQAFEMIKAGQRDEAGRILVALLKQDRNNADAWWLLANASNDTTIARQALENVLRVRPGDTRARQKLDQLNAANNPSPTSGRFSMGVSPSSTPPSDPFGAAAPFDALPDFDDVPPAPSDPFPPASSWSSGFGSSSSTPPVTPYSDFGKDLFGSTSSSDDPFGDPFGEPTVDTRRPPSTPIGDPLPDPVISRPGARTVTTSSTSLTGDDPFGSTDFGGDPFSGAASSNAAFGSPIGGRQKRSGANPVVVVLAVVGVLTLCSCIACLVVGGGGLASIAPELQEAFQELQGIVLTVTAMPGISTDGNGQPLPSNLHNRGKVSFDQSVSSSVDTFTDDSWSFSGSANDEVTIEVIASDRDLDPQLELYDPQKKQIASNDDIDFMSNKNSRLTITLPKSGTYTIVISAFGSGGAYTLNLTH